MLYLYMSRVMYWCTLMQGSVLYNHFTHGKLERSEGSSITEGVYEIYMGFVCKVIIPGSTCSRRQKRSLKLSVIHIVHQTFKSHV